MCLSLHRKCSVLYIDDSADNHLLFQHAVVKTETPLHIQPFVSGEPAIAYLRLEAPFAGLSVDPYPSFILCDYDLGSCQGDDLVAAIRAIHSSAALPIIMLSDLGGDNSVANSYQAGADLFLRKPTTPSRLAIIVRTLYACAVSNPRNFNPLMRLLEYQLRPAKSRATFAAPLCVPS
jgi:CheY-like chemotaxis protein